MAEQKIESTDTSTQIEQNAETPPSDYETYCQQQLDDMLDNMDGRCFGDMAEGQFVRSH